MSGMCTSSNIFDSYIWIIILILIAIIFFTIVYYIFSKIFKFNKSNFKNAVLSSLITVIIFSINITIFTVIPLQAIAIFISSLFIIFILTIYLMYKLYNESVFKIATIILASMVLFSVFMFFISIPLSGLGSTKCIPERDPILPPTIDDPLTISRDTINSRLNDLNVLRVAFLNTNQKSTFQINVKKVNNDLKDIVKIEYNDDPIVILPNDIITWTIAISSTDIGTSLYEVTIRDLDCPNCQIYNKQFIMIVS